MIFGLLFFFLFLHCHNNHQHMAAGDGLMGALEGAAHFWQGCTFVYAGDLLLKEG